MLCAKYLGVRHSLTVLLLISMAAPALAGRKRMPKRTHDSIASKVQKVYVRGIRRCFDNAQQESVEEIHWRFRLKFAVLPDGRVAELDIASAPAAFENCVSSRAKRWKFGGSSKKKLRVQQTLAFAR